MKISNKSIAWWWYQDWVRRGGRKPPVLNLCHFMRVMLFWAPLRAIVIERDCNGRDPRNWPLLGWLVIPPAGAVLLGILLFISPILILIWIVERYEYKWNWGWSRLWAVWQRKCVEPFYLLRDYRAARASKTCPIIEIGEKL